MNDFQQLFSRRVLILGALKATFMSALIGRLYYLQILKGSHYKILSDKNHLQSNLIEPSRGMILDRKGLVLAAHKSSYRSYLTPDLTKTPVETLQSLVDLLKITPSEHKALIGRYRHSKRTKLLIREDLSWDELSMIELHREELKGIVIEKGEKRFYPYANETCHVVGYVSAVTQKDQQPNNPLLLLPSFRIGKNGIEKTYNKTLQGEAGMRQVAVDAYGRVAEVLETYNPTKGEDLTLTLDIDLQQKVMKLLEQHASAAAIVMDPHTGGIHALCSTPTFNSQLFTNNLSKKDWKEISGNPYKPLINKATQGLYAPGSIFKIIVALAGLEEKIITPDTHAHCRGVHEVNGHFFHCWNWKQGGHGTVNIQSAITRSCDVFFYQMATRLGINNIAKMARSFGFGSLTGIDLIGEKEGLVPSKEWKKATKHQAWTGGDSINTSIGQGYLLSTPLQNAKMMAMLVNGQKEITPHFCSKHQNPNPKQLSYDPNNIKLILKAMDDVVNSSSGTAYNSRIMSNDFTMGGKTASTQVSRITMQERREGTHNDRSYEQKEHAMFVAFAPVENPRFVVSVLVEHGGGGAKVAAPLARDIAIAAHEAEKDA